MAVARRSGCGSGRAIFTSARTQTIRKETDHERAEHRAAGWMGAWWNSDVWPRPKRFGLLGPYGSFLAIALVLLVIESGCAA